MRTLHTGLRVDDVRPRAEALAEALFRHIPAGLGSTGAIHLRRRELEAMLAGGAEWAVEQGWGQADDLERIEEGAAAWPVPSPGSLRQGQEAPAKRNGHARLRQPLPGGPAGDRDPRRGCGPGLRSGRG
ncbi:MAG: RtcB family protein [Arhodomonas sp.]|nr:RtcB family protein [Arhodomonas sp.]